ncbi:single-stranded DNA-binding protein, partial [Haemophilus seminalis]
IKIDDRSMNDALRNTINRLKDKTVMVLVYPREWAMENGRKGITYNFDESSLIEELKQ